MERKALIIYCTNTSSGTLNGPYKDNQNFIDYLKSDVGGQWYNEEIVSIQNPNKNDIIRIISNDFNNVDYSFIVFSGHGYISINDNLQYIEINNCDIPILELRTNAKRQTIIIDACRGYYQPIHDSKQTRFSNLYEYATGHPNTRGIFEAAVEQADEGITVLFSADENQSSLDTDKGGAYLLSLLSVCKEWERKTNERNCYYPINYAHDEACLYIKKHFVTNQNPVMNQEKRRYYFPLAVK